MANVGFTRRHVFEEGLQDTCENCIALTLTKYLFSTLVYTDETHINELLELKTSDKCEFYTATVVCGRVRGSNRKYFIESQCFLHRLYFPAFICVHLVLAACDRD